MVNENKINNRHGKDANFVMKETFFLPFFAVNKYACVALHNVMTALIEYRNLPFSFYKFLSILPVYRLR